MEWISSLFLTDYGQRSRASFFNICIKKNFGFGLINVKIILDTKTKLNSHGSSASKRMLSMSFLHAANCLNSFLLSVNYTCPSLQENRKSNIFPYLHYQGFQNKPAAAGAPAGVTRFTVGYFVLAL